VLYHTHHHVREVVVAALAASSGLRILPPLVALETTWWGLVWRKQGMLTEEPRWGSSYLFFFFFFSVSECSLSLSKTTRLSVILFLYEIWFLFFYYYLFCFRYFLIIFFLIPSFNVGLVGIGFRDFFYLSFMR